MSNTDMSGGVRDFGRGIKLRSQEHKLLDLNEAQRLLDLGAVQGERPLRKGHVETLVAAMERGTFLFERADVSIAYVKGKTKPVRVNGQHTCAARLKMPAGFKCEISFLVYDVETERDLRKLYASIDRNAPRTKGHVIGTYLLSNPVLAGLPQHVLKVLPAGFALWRFPTKHDRTGVDGDAVAVSMLSEHVDLVTFVGEVLEKLDAKDDRHMFRAPVVAAMLATFNKVKGPSKDFWGKIADGDGFSGRDDPRRLLRDALISTSIGAGGRSGSRRRAVSPEELYRGCLHAWNAWRKGEKLAHLRLHQVGDRPEIE
jgi:hypothetical protein